MIPNAFKILRPQRIVLIIITLLIMLHQFIPHVSADAQGRLDSWACNAMTVKLKPFFNKAADAFLAIKNSEVTTVHTPTHHYVYTITAGTSPLFFIYQIEERKFICYKKNKNENKLGKFVARRIPTNEDCLFNQTISQIGGYTRLLVNKVPLQFNKHGKLVTGRSLMNTRHHKPKADFAEFTSSKCEVGDIRKLCKTFRPLKRYPKDLKSLCKDVRRSRM